MNEQYRIATKEEAGFEDGVYEVGKEDKVQYEYYIQSFNDKTDSWHLLMLDKPKVSYEDAIKHNGEWERNYGYHTIEDVCKTLCRTKIKGEVKWSVVKKIILKKVNQNK